MSKYDALTDEQKNNLEVFKSTVELMMTVAVQALNLNQLEME
jgi:hypothetical protein